MILHNGIIQPCSVAIWTTTFWLSMCWILFAISHMIWILHKICCLGIPLSESIEIYQGMVLRWVHCVLFIFLVICCVFKQHFPNRLGSAVPLIHKIEYSGYVGYSMISEYKVLLSPAFEAYFWPETLIGLQAPSPARSPFAVPCLFSAFRTLCQLIFSGDHEVGGDYHKGHIGYQEEDADFDVDLESSTDVGDEDQ